MLVGEIIQEGEDVSLPLVQSERLHRCECTSWEDGGRM